MKIRNMGQKYVTPQSQKHGTARATIQSALLLLLLPGQATYLFTSDLKAHSFLWKVLLL